MGDCFSFLAVFTTEHSRASHVSETPSAQSSMHIYGIRGQLRLALSWEGGSVCADVVYFQGVGAGVQLSEGGVDEIQV